MCHNTECQANSGPHSRTVKPRLYCARWQSVLHRDRRCRLFCSVSRWKETVCTVSVCWVMECSQWWGQFVLGGNLGWNSVWRHGGPHFASHMTYKSRARSVTVLPVLTAGCAHPDTAYSAHTVLVWDSYHGHSKTEQRMALRSQHLTLRYASVVAGVRSVRT
jgi:hypothetical protein